MLGPDQGVLVQTLAVDDELALHPASTGVGHTNKGQIGGVQVPAATRFFHSAAMAFART